MKHILQSLLRRLDLRVTRASTYERLVTETTASHRKVGELQADLDAVMEFHQAGRAQSGNENVDRVLEQISAAGITIAPKEFAEICAEYSAIRTSAGRSRVSAQLLSRLLSADPSATGPLSDLLVRSLAAHELYRQAAATRDFARGLLDQSLDAWKQISTDLPTPFNLACYARALGAKGDRRNAFFVLADAVDRHPRSAPLARDFAMFFAQLGEVEAANKALEPIRHTLLEERNGLAQQQVELDRSIDEGRTANQAGDESVITLWPEQHRRLSQRTEFQDPLVARDAALRRTIGDILRTDGTITTVIEFDTICADTIVRLAHEHAKTKFVSLAEDDAAALNAPLLDGTNASRASGGVGALLALAAGSHALLFHAGTADTTYPAKLAQLYGRCRELGIRHLVVGELVDFDRDRLLYHAPGSYPRVTRLGGGSRFLHDFKTLLGDAGYVVADSIAVPPGLIPQLGEAEAGYRLLHAVARD
jgi:hypothetical protein